MQRLLRALTPQRLLTTYVVLLFLIPSRLVFSSLGGAGSPEELMGLILLEVWILARFINRPGRPFGARDPVRTAYLAVLASFSVSFVVAMTRPIADEESSTAIQAYLLLLSWGGVLLFTNALLPDQDVLETLLRRIVLLGAIMALLALAQFVTGQLLIDRIWFPGLSANANQQLAAISERDGLNRPSSTAIHPIEFGAVITMILPLAITLAMHRGTRTALRAWAPVGLMSLAVFLSISRSAVIGMVLGVGTLMLAWSWRVRLRMMGAGVVLLGGIALTIPGMLGTLLGLFTSITGGDTSTQSRTASYPIAIAFIERFPFFGRGFGTFLPSLHILDNGLLGLFIEVGAIGWISMITLLVCGIVAGQTVRRHARTDRARQLGHALTAGLVAGSCGLGLYDGFGFPMGAACVFLFVGLAGAARRIALADEGSSPPDDSAAGQSTAPGQRVGEPSSPASRAAATSA